MQFILWIRKTKISTWIFLIHVHEINIYDKETIFFFLGKYTTRKPMEINFLN
jgi:hypothetical protein